MTSVTQKTRVNPVQSVMPIPITNHATPSESAPWGGFMAEETMTVPIKGVDMETDKGQGAVTLIIAPVTDKRARAIVAAAVGGELKIIIG